MNRYVFLFFIIFFIFVPKGFGRDEEIEIFQPKIISSTESLLDKPFTMSCKTRIPAETPFCFFWLYDIYDKNIEPNNSSGTEQRMYGYERETVIETNMTFTNVKKRHEGKHLCVLVTRKKDKIELFYEEAPLEVFDTFHLPKFDPESNLYVLDKGKTLTLKCSGFLEIQWKKMGMPPVDPYSVQKFEPIRGTQEYSKVQDEVHPFASTLKIENMQAQETGNYTCLYKTTDFMNLDIWEMEKNNLLRNAYIFIRDVQELYVKTPTVIMENFGSPLTIPCRPTFPAVEVELYKIDDEKRLYPEAYEINVNYSKTDGFTIPMTNHYKSVSGYSCIFKFNKNRKEVLFELLSEPSFYTLVPPTLLNFKPSPPAFQSVTLICHAPFIKYQPVNMEWKTDDTISKDVKISEMTIIKKNHYSIAELKLDIARFDEDYVGEYTCAVKGRHDISVESKTNLNINYPHIGKPILSAEGLEQKDSYTVKNGDSLTLVCWSGLPIVWKKSFMDVPEFDITISLKNFDRSIKNIPFLPLPKRGQVEIPINQYKTTFTYVESRPYPFIFSLKLSNLTGKDVGFYSCIHSDEKFSNYDVIELAKMNQAVSTYIYVEDSDRLNVPSVTEITGIQNKPILIPCRPTDPSTKVTLYKNNLQISEDKYKFEPRSGFLLTDTQNIGMKEKYVCHLSSKGEYSYIDYVVSSIPSPSSIERPVIVLPKSRPLIGTTVKISCSVKILLNVPFSFDILHPRYKNNENQRIRVTKVLEHTNNMTVSQINMTIYNVNTEDEGDYECEVYDYFNNAKSDYFFLDVFDTMEAAPVIEPNVTRVEVNVGDDLYLKCNALSSQTTWFIQSKIYRPKGDITFKILEFMLDTGKNQWLLYSIDDKRATQTTSTDDDSDLPFSTELILKSVTVADVGYYTCAYDDDVTLQINDVDILLKQKRGSRIYVFVKSEEKLLVPLAYTKMKFKKNTNLVIPCKPTSFDIVTTLYKDEIAISSVNHPSENVQFDKTEGFLVHSPLLSHENEFKCISYLILDNSTKITENMTLYADVIPDDVFVPRLDLGQMIYNDSFEITCSVICSQNTVLRLSWIDYPTKTDRKVTFEDSSNIEIDTDFVKVSTNMSKISSRIKISKVNSRHQGLFQCKMEDLYGNTRFVEKYVTLYGRIYTPPYIFPRDNEINVEVGDFSIVCGSDRPVMWKVPSETDRPFGDITRKAESLNNENFVDLSGLSDPSPERYAVKDSILDDGSSFIHISSLTIKRVNHMDTGFYSCLHRNIRNFSNIYDMETTGQASRIYIFVNDHYNIFKPIANNTIFYLPKTVFTIPCLPTSSKVVVDLYSDDKLIQKTNYSYISFDPTTGFTIYNDAVLNINKPIKCSFYSAFSDVKFQEFYLVRIPRKYYNQEVKVYSTATNVVNCETKLYKKIPYGIRWTFPNKDVENRVVIHQNCTEYNLVRECQSIMTIKDFTHLDSGYYTCKRIDIYSKVETASLALIILAENEREEWKYLLQTSAQMYCGRMPQDRIIGGREADLGEYPWIARIGFRICLHCPQIEYLCGGSLIGEQFIVTTGFCINKPYDDAEPVIRLGESGPLRSESQIIKGVKQIVHPQYKMDGPLYDVAVLMLEHPIEFDDWVYPICLPRENVPEILFRAKNTYEIAGWGLSKEYAGIVSEVLRKGLIQLSNPIDCQSYIPEAFCASGDVIPCFEDFGYPVMSIEEYESTPLYFLVGLTSMDADIDCTEKSQIYPNVSYHLDFILRSVKLLHDQYEEENP